MVLAMGLALCHVEKREEYHNGKDTDAGPSNEYF